MMDPRTQVCVKHRLTARGLGSTPTGYINCKSKLPARNGVRNEKDGEMAVL